MITKVAKVQAMREAFPSQLGAMYTSDEVNIKDAEYEDVSARVEMEKAAEANSEEVGFDTAGNDAAVAHDDMPGDGAPSAIPGF